MVDAWNQLMVAPVGIAQGANSGGLTRAKKVSILLIIDRLGRAGSEKGVVPCEDKSLTGMKLWIGGSVLSFSSCAGYALDTEYGDPRDLRQQRTNHVSRRHAGPSGGSGTSGSRAQGARFGVIHHLPLVVPLSSKTQSYTVYT